MPSLQSHGTQKNSSIHASVLIYVQSNVHVLVQLSRFCLLFWLYILLVHVNASYVSGVLNIVVLFSLRMVSVWLVVNYDSVTSVVNDY